MGENGEQGKLRVTQTVKENLPKLEKIPEWRGQINIRTLAKKIGVPFRNFYDNEEAIALVNKRAKKQNLEPLPTPEERAKLADENPGEVKSESKSADAVALEGQIRSLEKRLVAAENTNRDLQDENKKLAAENERLKRENHLDELALNGRPARDTARQIQ